MSAVADERAPAKTWLDRGDLGAIAWAVACCWVAVWGNFLLLALGVTVFYIVPIDLFVVPLLVTAAFLALRRRRKAVAP
jgi:hypothetical protein